jgi:hypothetical protein
VVSFLLAVPSITYMHSSPPPPHSCYMNRPSHPPRLDYSNYTWQGVHKSRSSSLCSFLHPPVTSSIFGPNFSSAPCSQTDSVYVLWLLRIINLGRKWLWLWSILQCYKIVLEAFTKITRFLSDNGLCVKIQIADTQCGISVTEHVAVPKLPYHPYNPYTATDSGI